MSHGVGKSYGARGIGATRAVAVLAASAFTLPLMPLEALLLRVDRRRARNFPQWYQESR
jgi:hypothetical protein